jgi:phosphoglycerate dehydrogenase-like enzyme
MSERLLIAHDRADLYLAELRRRFPGLEVEVCRRGEALPGLLERFRPTIAYGCKTDGFGGPAQRPLSACPSLRWLHVGGSGFDHLQQWDAERLLVTNSRGVLAPFLAEVAIGAMIALAFGLPTYLRQQGQRLWQKQEWRPLAGRTLVIAGPGAIGREVARLGRAHGMRTIGVARRPTALPELDEHLPMSDLGPALERAEVLSLHLPLTPETTHLIDAAALARLPPGALLVNTARGPVVDEAALVRALASGRLGGAYLDVFEQEPLPAESPLWGLDNVILTPHCADSVADWQERLAAFFMENLEVHLGGGIPRHRVGAATPDV